MNTKADILIHNAKIWTADNKNPTAEAIALGANKILALGNFEQLKNLADKDTKLINAYGRSVLPGLTDAHLHLIEGGSYLSRPDFRNCRSKEDFQQILLKHHHENPYDKWIIGGNWNHELWHGQLPDKLWIDEVLPHIPVWLTRMDGHMGLANQKAMEIAGLDKRDTSVKGGEVKMNKHGEFTGLFTDNAMKLITSQIPPLTHDEKVLALRLASNYLLSLGITSVHYMPLFEPLDLDLLRQFRTDNLLKLRIYTGYPIDFALANNLLPENDEFLKIGFVKAFADGSLGSQTAFMSHAYLNSDNCGISTLDYDEYLQKIMRADKMGWQIVTHAIGDKANDELSICYEKLQHQNGLKDRRLRVEHAQMLKNETIRRMVHTNTIASMQPVHLLDEIDWAHTVIGYDRISSAYRTKTLLNEGIKLAFGSDWFVAIPNPMWGIYAATTRSKLSFFSEEAWVNHEKISLEQTLLAYTRDAAFASFDENLKGILKEGFLADVIILNNDIFTTSPDDLKYVQTETTILNGKIVYQRK
jgi:predicted amidohydrolase YtcJ